MANDIKCYNLYTAQLKTFYYARKYKPEWAITTRKYTIYKYTFVCDAKIMLFINIMYYFIHYFGKINFRKKIQNCCKNRVLPKQV